MMKHFTSCLSFPKSAWDRIVLRLYEYNGHLVCLGVTRKPIIVTTLTSGQFLGQLREVYKLSSCKVAINEV